MNDQIEAPTPEDEPSRLKLWQVMIQPNDPDDRRVYQIVVRGKGDALAEAMRRYREDLELVSEVTEQQPIVIERIGKNATRVTDAPRGTWWRGLFRGR